MTRFRASGRQITTVRQVVQTIPSASLLLLTESAHADRLADDGAWSGTVGNITAGGGTANATINGGTGMAVNVNAVSGKFIGIGNPTTLGTSLGTSEAAINPAWYSPDMTPTATRYGFNMMIVGTTLFANSTIVDASCRHLAGSSIGSIVNCHGGSSFAISFKHPVTNPVLHISRLGGNFFNADGTFFNIWSTYRLSTTGASLSLVNGNGQLAVTGGATITIATPLPGSMIGNTSNGSATCAGAANLPTACGSVRVNETFSTLTFDGALDIQRASGTSAVDTTINPGRLGDSVHWMITVHEDYGDAPASYDPVAGASHILSDLRLGTSATPDNTTVITVGNAASPFIGTAMPNPTANGDQYDDGIDMPTSVSNVQGAITNIPIELSNASKPGSVCGWIDFDRSGTFSNDEGACTPFAAGASTASLTFVSPATSGTGSTVARFRASYDTMTTSMFTGLLDSGEVEDYVTTLATPPILRLRKNLPLGRFSPGDQFEQSISGVNPSVVTEGTGSTATGEVLLDPAITGSAYTLAEHAAGTTDLSKYTVTWSCTNNSNLLGAQIPSGTGSSFEVVPSAGDDIACTLFNKRAPLADLSVTKTNSDTTVTHGQQTTFAIVVSNHGPDPVTGAIVADPTSSRIGLDCTMPPTCSGAACPAGPLTVAGLDSGIVLGTLTNGGSVTVMLTCTVQ